MAGSRQGRLPVSGQVFRHEAILAEGTGSAPGTPPSGGGLAKFVPVEVLTRVVACALTD